MAFVVEDGTGITDANAYIAVAFFRDYHTDRGTDTSSFTPDSVVEGAIVRATDYVDKRFGNKYRGFKQGKDQGLEWPRLSAFDNDDFLLNGIDAVPRQMQKAIAEYTLITLQLGDLLPTPARPFSSIDPTTGDVVSSPSGQITRLKEKVDVIEQTTSYSNNSELITNKKPGASSSTMVTDINIPEYPVADEWLQELVRPDFSVNLQRGN